ncbi:MAG: S24/S26 family peptidase [Firmicutes bacterium]|nr:S24/S26 family peptidase [Bacillota bacterium]
MQIKNTSIVDLCPLIEQLLPDRNIKLTIKGNSMYPLLRSNVDSVILTQVKKIKKYDLLFYKRDDGKFVIHRVVAFKNDAICMAGDFETETEYPVYPHQAIATVKSFYRGKHHISCNGLLYKTYSFLWVLLLPKRHFIIVLLKKLKQASSLKRWMPL